MMNHVTARLQAYQDGELESRAAEAVEAHLAACGACLAEFEALETLSALLHEFPPATQLMSEDRFAAQVALRLPRYHSRSLPERTFHWGWRLAPILLVATWAFVEAAAILTSGIAALLRLGVGTEVVESLIAEQTVTSGFGLGAAEGLLQALGGDAVLGILRQVAAAGRITIIPLLFTGLTALAICSWVATWWAAERHPLGQSGGQQGVRSKE